MNDDPLLAVLLLFDVDLGADDNAPPAGLVGLADSRLAHYDPTSREVGAR